MLATSQHESNGNSNWNEEENGTQRKEKINTTLKINKTKINIFHLALETPNKILIKISTIRIQSKTRYLNYGGFNKTSK